MTHNTGLDGPMNDPGAGLPRHGLDAWRRTAIALCAATLLGGASLANAAGADTTAAGAKAAAPAASAASSAEPFDPNEPGDVKPPVVNSQMGGLLFKYLLIAELESREGAPGDAVELYVQIGRELKDGELFNRAIEIAVQNSAGDKALDVAKAWRQTLPESKDAVRMQVSLLFALDRVADTSEPLAALLALSPPGERAALIAGLPRAALRAKDKSAVSAQFEQLLQPYMEAPETRVAARVALARLRMGEGRNDAALALGWEAVALEPDAIGVALLGLDLMAQPGAVAWSGQPGDRSAEAIVRRYLDTPHAEPVVRQALAAVMTQQQRIAEAAEQVRLAAQARPGQVMLWLSLGELEIELRHPEAADEALQKALALALAGPAKPAAEASAPETPAANADGEGPADGEDDEAASPQKPGQPDDAMAGPARLARIHLMLARSAQLRHDDADSARWLAKIPPKDQDLPVISLRADLMARHGKLADARRLIQAAPADTDEAKRLRTLTEVQLLREHKKLPQAREVLATANAAKPDDVDLLYEQAMIDERLDKLEEMEKLLRHVITLQPDHAQAMNALGYSLADRRLRLDEALQLVTRAHELAPADPFIVDSLGWIEFRRGHLPEATRWLRQAYTARNDTEIAAHLGEALWAQGEHDEALRIFLEARKRDADNEVLRETMRRLRAVP